MGTFKRLRYFEFSLYNNAEEPSFTHEQIDRLLVHLPKDIRECCIYTSLNFTNLDTFIKPWYTEKFEYLELGCNYVYQRTSHEALQRANKEHQEQLMIHLQKVRDQ